jgi:nucleotide-binding universal stress UspA family protein
MTPFESILVATDFSVGGNNAVRRAALIAQQQGGHLSLLHIVEPAGHALRPTGRRAAVVEPQVAQAQATLRRMSAELGERHGVAVDFEVRVGDPFKELLQASAGRALVVLGHGGKRRFMHRVVGKFAERFLRCCPCPVLAVKRPVGGAYGKLLVPVDFEPCSQAALLAAASLAGDGELHVFHALVSKPAPGVSTDTGAKLPAGPGDDNAYREEAGTFARLRRSIVRLGLRSRQVGILLGRGPAVQSTLHQAALLQADLIVAGKQGRQTIARFLLGNVSRHLVAESPCDIVIVPPLPAEVAVAPPARAEALPAAPAMPPPALLSTRADGGGPDGAG